MSVRVRFAPSPTGRLHVGNLRPALLNYLIARESGGWFLLRLDDTDTERSTQEFADSIVADLKWLGFEWDAFARQSDRRARYDEALAQLIADGRAYPCYETADELGLKRKSLLSRGQPPIYDRAALKLTDAEKAAYEAEGRKPHWRFLLNDGDISWTDGILGDRSFAQSNLSDPVLVREDGRPLYTLTSCVDDVDFGITHIVRGEDHITNTATQVQLIEALGGTVPTFGHFPLIKDADGEKLSKRLDSLGVRQLRAAGYAPMAILSLLARLGTSDPIEPLKDIDALAEGFSLSKISRNSPRFAPEEIRRLNGLLLQEKAYTDVRTDLETYGFERVTPEIWEAVRPNLTVLHDLGDILRLIEGPVEPVIEEPEYIAAALSALPADPWDRSTWGAWTSALKAETGRKGRQLFQPLRLALTGATQGPEMQALLPLIGRERAVARLSTQTATA